MNTIFNSNGFRIAQSKSMYFLIDSETPFENETCWYASNRLNTVFTKLKKIYQNQNIAMKLYSIKILTQQGIKEVFYKDSENLAEFEMNILKEFGTFTTIKTTQLI